MPRHSRIPRIVLALALLSGGADARAGVNQLSGTAGFSNASAEILAILGAPANAGLSSLTLNATSVPPAPFSSHDVSGPASARVQAAWSLDVEGSAAGTAYRVVASAQLGAVALKDDYYFLPVTSDPVFDAPAPGTNLDILECAGVARVRFVDAGGAPVTVRGDRITADSSAGGASPLAMIFGAVTQKDVIVRGDGSTWTLRAEITTGGDPFTDRMTVQRTASAVIDCDEIVDVPMIVPVPGAAELGSISGRLDILGEDEVTSAGGVANARSRVEGSGPWRNLRADVLPGPPSSGAWTLENLVASSVVAPSVPWRLYAEAAFGTGYQAAAFTTPSIDFDVPEGAAVDAGDVFVIDPVRITGSVLLRGPAATPSSPSPLQAIWRPADRDTNRDGVPDDLARFFDSTCVTGRGRFGIASGATRSALGATGLASIEGAFDPDASSFVGTYRVVLGNLEGEPGIYEADELNVKLLATATPQIPSSYLDVRVDIDDPGPTWELPGGGGATRDRAYCFSQVTLHLQGPGNAAFYAPNATGTGAFAGTNFLGQPAAYDATLWWARGTPRTLSEAAITGQTTFILPEGDWVIEPSVFVPQPGGSTQLVTLPTMSLTVGCGQVIGQSPELQLLLDPVAPCAAAGALRVTGTAHGDAGIDEITWSVNGGAPQQACAPCGIDVVLGFDAMLEPGDGVVLVEAVDAGGRRVTAELRVRVADEVRDLRVAKDPGGLLLSWREVPGDTIALHQGSIAALRGTGHDHDRVGACGRSGASAAIPMPSGDVYFLAGASCGAGEGSLGSDSLGAERPASVNPCP